MEITHTTNNPATTSVDALIAYVADATTMPSVLSELDASLGGAISRELSRERLRAGKGDVTTITGGVDGPQRIILATIGTTHDGERDAVRTVGGRLASACRAARATSVAMIATGDAEQTADVLEGYLLGAYRYERFKSHGSQHDADVDGVEASRPAPLASLELLGAQDDEAAAATRAATLANAVNWGRDLANAPANHLTPEILGFHAEQLAQRHDHLSCTLLDRAEIEARGMGMLAGVAQGSSNEPRLIVLEWNPPQDTRPDAERLALIGKAVTFDTGGISIKPSAGMAEMKLDKSGGCAVLAAMRAIAELEVPRKVLAIIGATENMPDAAAYKPGDVITAMDGTNVEITNTDAEGRLVLGDAICFARELGCSRLVEISTLTGAMVIALGHHFTGCVARHGDLTDQVLAAAQATGDHAWHLPMHDTYKPSLKSDCADMINAGGRAGSSLSAAMFLEHFAKDTPLVHLDVAGTAMLPKPQGYHTAKGASGWGVRLFVELVANS